MIHGTQFNNIIQRLRDLTKINEIITFGQVLINYNLGTILYYHCVIVFYYNIISQIRQSKQLYDEIITKNMQI